MDIDALLEPTLVVGSDGAIRELNAPARALCTSLEPSASLREGGRGASGALHPFFVRCAGAKRPIVGLIDLPGGEDVRRFHAYGQTLDPCPPEEAASVLLRLLACPQGHMAARAERMRRVGVELRRRLSDQRAECKRLGRQVLTTFDALRLAEGEKRELRSEIQRIRTEERERIAHDLHDQAGQELAAIIAELRALRENRDPGLATRLDAVADRLGDTGRRLHQAIAGARPRIVEELGLKRAIEVTLVAYAADGRLAFAFSSSGTEPADMKPALESALYRVAQEALTNVLKHATGARTVKASLDFEGDGLVLAIRDDGAGFDPAEAHPPNPLEGGFGLRGMRQRMAAVDGTLDVSSRLGRGTIVTARAKLSPDGSP